MKLTGCLSTNVLSPGEGPLPTHGTLLAPGLNAQVHQHFFCARLDMAVDDPHGGRALTVTEARGTSQEGSFGAVGVVALMCLSARLTLPLPAMKRVETKGLH